MSTEKENELVRFCNKHKHITWLIFGAGKYDISIMIVAESLKQIETVYWFQENIITCRRGDGDTLLTKTMTWYGKEMFEESLNNFVKMNNRSKGFGFVKH